MYILTTLLFSKNRIKKFIIAISLFLLAFYPIYKNIYFGRAVEQVQRHIDFLNRESQFYNPWQYRVFTPWLVEGTYVVYNNTIDLLFPIEDKIVFNLPESTTPKELIDQLFNSFKQKGNLKYFMIFVFYRLLFNILIFLLLYKILKAFIINKYLMYLAIIVASLLLGNSVNDSDFTLHTYLDVILYLLTGCLILFKWKDYWIIPISILGALNRETSIMIPYLFFLSKVDWGNLDLSIKSIWAARPKNNVIFITAISYVVYIAIFIGIRWYYGYVEQTEWKVPAGWQMIKLNLFSIVSVKTYFEMFGTISLFPFIFLWYFKKMPFILKLWFIAIVPIWFIVHWYSVVAYQSRLFLVPTFLIFLPAVLFIIEDKYRSLKLN